MKQAIKVIKEDKEYIMNVGAITVAIDYADSWEIIEVTEDTELSSSIEIIN
jgi:hypothetical protein